MANLPAILCHPLEDISDALPLVNLTVLLDARKFSGNFQLENFLTFLRPVVERIGNNMDYCGEQQLSFIAVMGEGRKLYVQMKLTESEHLLLLMCTI